MKKLKGLKKNSGDIKRQKEIKMARNILIEVSKDEEARAYYESELIFELDQNGKMNHAKREGVLSGPEG